MTKQNKRILEGLMRKWDKLDERQATIWSVTLKGEETLKLILEYHQNEKDLHEVTIEFIRSLDNAIAK